MRNKIIGLALALLAPIAAAKAVNGSVNYIQPEEGNSFVKTEAFYRAPLDINGFSFVNFNKGGYFGKTDLKRPIAYGIGPEVEVIHCNEPISGSKAGVNLQIPKLPRTLFGNVRVLPVRVDREGVHTGNIGFFAGANLPYGVQLKAFGDWKLDGSWDYGEGSVGKGVGPMEAGYNAAITAADITHRFYFKVIF